MIQKRAVVFIVLVFLSACSVQEEDTPLEPLTQDRSSSQINTKPCGDGVCDSIEQEGNGCPEDCENTDISLETKSSDEQWWPDSNGAWSGNLILASSEDGLTFTQGETLIQYGGVPNLLYTSQGQLIATYQYFSREDESLYDVIAYSVSEDEGETWTEPQILTFEGLPEATTGNKNGEMFVTKAVDPTLVETSEGGLRLYFTYQSVDEAYARLASAYSQNGDISSSFVYEKGERPILEDGPMLDPSAVFFEEMWHHYSWDMDSTNNYHSVSKDGVNFELQDNIENLDMDFLGQVVVAGDGLRFYGTGKGISSAFSEDGYTWEMEEGKRLSTGADPGVAQLADGSYIMLYTSGNFNQAPKN